MNLSNLRPGIYSDYSTSSRYATPRARRGAGLVVVGTTISSTVHKINSLAAAQELLSTQATALACCRILLESGVGTVSVSFANNKAYAPAFARLEAIPEIGLILTDATTLADATIALQSVEKSSNQQRERMVVFSLEDVSAAVTMAGHLNHSRCLVTTGTGTSEKEQSPLLLGAALVGQILASNNPMLNLNGLVLPAIDSVKALPEDDVQHALAKGVIPFELVGGQVECIRGVTTKTTTNGATDYTLRSINTTLVIDDTLATLRSALTAKLKGSSALGLSLDSIASQVVVELAEKQQQGLLRSYEAPRVYASPDDPETCVVELAFTVAHVVSQIHIKAHIRL